MTHALYARLYRLDDGTKCYEPLQAHLALTSFAMLLLCLKSPWCRRDDNNIKIAVLAGLLHDIGKALSVYQKAGATRLSFGNPPHEEVSAYVASCVLSILSQAQQANRQVQYTVAKAIEMHHQGLRLLTLLESREALNLVKGMDRRDLDNIRRCIKESVDLFERMLAYPGNLNYRKDFADLLNRLKNIAELDLEQCTQSWPSMDIVIVKLFTGMLIVADYLATKLNLLRVSNKCVEETLIANEVHSYVLSLNLSMIQDIIYRVLEGYTTSNDHSS